jgi:hypothetical protein
LTDEQEQLILRAIIAPDFLGGTDFHDTCSDPACNQSSLRVILGNETKSVDWTEGSINSAYQLGDMQNVLFSLAGTSNMTSN